MKKSPLILILFVLQAALHGYAQDCGTRQLDPRMTAFLKLIGHQDLTLEQLRAIPIDVIKFSGPPPMPYPREEVQRIKITADSIPVLVFNPTRKRDLPIMINYHGGGFIAPLIPGIEHELWQEAKNYGVILFAVDYRVAPENKYPAAVHDSYNAFKWIAQHGKEFGGDPNRIVLSGNSAGANLVAVITHKAKKEGISDLIKLQVLNGLPADCRASNMETSLSYQQNAVGYMQTKAACYFALETYAPGQTDNPEVSPALYSDFKNLPPAVIITAEFDPLRDDGPLYANKLKKAGVKVWEKCFPGQIHCLIGLPPESAEIQEFISIVKSAMIESFK